MNVFLPNVAAKAICSLPSNAPTEVHIRSRSENAPLANTCGKLSEILMKSKLFAALTASVLVATSMAMSSTSPQAAPLSGDLAVSSRPSLSLTDVQYRGRGYGGYGGGYGFARPYYGRPYGGGGWRYRGGAWPWVGLAAGVAAGAIIYNRTYRPRVGYYYDTYDYDGPYYYPTGFSGNPRTICARHFKSFEWDSGMYTTYGGQRRLCPYLQ